MDGEEVLVHFDGWSSRYDEFIHIRAGRLRYLTREKLEKIERERQEKALKIRVSTCMSHSHLEFPLA